MTQLLIEMAEVFASIALCLVVAAFAGRGAGAIAWLWRYEKRLRGIR